jgi:uncharacterized protein YndB with AHSA1/START domain
MMEIDQNASLVARKEIDIAAPPEKVFALEADIAHWPDWQPDVALVKVEGNIAVGTVFRWKGGGLNIVSTIQEYEPPHRIGWTGDAFGTRAVHHWMFEPQDGGTHVRVEESLSGWLPRILKVFMPDFLSKGMEASLQVLKKKAEQG